MQRCMASVQIDLFRVINRIGQWLMLCGIISSAYPPPEIRNPSSPRCGSPAFAIALHPKNPSPSRSHNRESAPPRAHEASEYSAGTCDGGFGHGVRGVDTATTGNEEAEELSGEKAGSGR